MTLALIPKSAICGVASLAALLLAPSISSAAPVPGDPCPNGDRRAEQAKVVPAVMDLPDCMALEMVSPPRKLNQFAAWPNVSPDGERIQFGSIAALAEPPNHVNPLRNPYVATRGASSWTTESAAAPPDRIVDPNLVDRSFTPDFSSWIYAPIATASQVPLQVSEVMLGGLGMAPQSLSGPMVPETMGLSSDGPTAISGSLLQGASADHSHVYFRPGPSGADRRTSYLAGDPVPAGAGSSWNVYVASLDPAGQPSLELLARDKDGKAWGGNCGARLGGIEATSGAGLTAPNGNRNQGAVSPGGEHVYFSTRAVQPPGETCSNANKLRILERLETAGGPVISELIANECEREAPEPACATHDGDDLYQGASVDQTKVYFTTNRQLASTDLDGSATECSGETAVIGCDLYLYDSTKPEGDQLTQVSVGDSTAPTPGVGARVFNGIAAISGDGSRVYFIAHGVLTEAENPEGDQAVDGQPNLYTWSAETEEIAFIGIAQGDLRGSSRGTLKNDAYPVPVKGSDVSGKEVGGDGSLLLFQSTSALTSDDNDGSFRDIFRYDATEHTLERISKAEPGGDDDAGRHVDVLAHSGQTGLGTDFAEVGRWVSEDGQTVAFRTQAGLLPGDATGPFHSYLWREGKLHRLPGVPFTGKLDSPHLSHDGRTVAFQTVTPLLPEDGDTASDIYVARAGGGFPFPPPEQPCNPDGEAGCQGPVFAGGAFAVAGTAPTRGNVRPGRNCAAMARQARNLRQRAQRLRRQARRSSGSRQARQKRRQAARSAKRAQRLSADARRCRQANRRAGR